MLLIPNHAPRNVYQRFQCKQGLHMFNLTYDIHNLELISFLETDTLVIITILWDLVKYLRLYPQHPFQMFSLHMSSF